MKSFFKIPVVAALIIVVLLSCKEEQITDKSNPFFSSYNTPFDVPLFEKIKAKHYMPAFEKGIEDARKDLEAITGNRKSPTFENKIGRAHV